MCPVWYGNDARASQSPSICMQWIDNIQLYNRATVRNRASERMNIRERETETAGCECTTTRRQTTSTSSCARPDTRLRDYTSWQSLSARRSRRVPRASPAAAAAAIVASSTTCSPRRHRHRRRWCSRRLRSQVSPTIAGIPPTLAPTPPKCQRDLQHSATTPQCQSHNLLKVMCPVLFFELIFSHVQSSR